MNFLTLIILLTAFTSACQAKKNHHGSGVSSSENYKDEQLAFQYNVMTCLDGSPTFVIFEKATRSLKYCDNGSWREIENQATQTELDVSHRKQGFLPNQKTVKHKIPDAHKILNEKSAPKSRLPLKAVENHNNGIKTSRARTSFQGANSLSKDPGKDSLSHSNTSIERSLPDISKLTVSEKPKEGIKKTQIEEIPNEAILKNGSFHCRSVGTEGNKSYRCQRAH